MNETKKLKGRDLITIGIFSALYFILNLAAMITGFVPVLWLLLPAVYRAAIDHLWRCLRFVGGISGNHEIR